ncbi:MULTISPECIES: winged helix-turn-helix domain-containing protein [unclassified Rathayibacter]|uniref:winged helix-turn-helix domain-containing protein n=1 Tax=unclassified Rathayibacter TaxID=2609250 RepID=UPI00188A5D4B|nr:MULTISPECIES: crosslink repair DNA glycosylase YcaQ family protein [unclassified Rathayibacter]MBF4463415.1 YcaQ family DNA glycosylase [Rathayibacter sp. VKM Ac-2879]MBF4504862.1 YcaQ family DNA glycosylase [Rathayibacter sp. VKM Ac-2878]
MTEQLSPALARRIALAAQGFGVPRPARVGARQVVAAVDRLRPLQLDSVNVFERSHYLPLLARLGPYERSLLDAAAFSPSGPFLEYWAHEAALIRREDLPLYRWRMEQYRRVRLPEHEGWAAENRATLDWLRAALADGPLRASEIEHEANTRTGPWWGWSDIKRGLEVLFRWGEVVTAGRVRFERSYGLAAQLVPRDVLDVEIPAAEAMRELVRRASRALGVATLGDLADYHRLLQAPTRAAVLELVEAGELEPVEVRGWERGGRPLPLWRHVDSRRPRSLRADALLSPFDPVVWHRPRAELFFDFHYRIEIYTPAEQRVHGYYVLPVLLDDTIAARVDLKSERRRRVLLVQAAWLEPGAPADTAERLATLLVEAAQWQGLDAIEIVGAGTLAPALLAALSTHHPEALA